MKKFGLLFMVLLVCIVPLLVAGLIAGCDGGEEEAPEGVYHKGLERFKALEVMSTLTVNSAATFTVGNDLTVTDDITASGTITGAQVDGTTGTIATLTSTTGSITTLTNTTLTVSGTATIAEARITDIYGWEGGSFTLNSGSTSYSVTHGCNGTPSAMNAQPDGGIVMLRVGTPTSTTFTVTRSGTDTANRTVYWLGTTE